MKEKPNKIQRKEQKMKEKTIDLDALEMVDVKISPKAFKPEIIHCSLCNKKMKKSVLEIEITPLGATEFCATVE